MMPYRRYIGRCSVSANLRKERGPKCVLLVCVDDATGQILHSGQHTRTQSGPNATQFARAMGEFNIDVLCAHSLQARGRVERAHLDDANRFAHEFIEDYNRRFGRAPAGPRDAQRRLRADENLDEVLRCADVIGW
jgi:hypothetical protein